MASEDFIPKKRFLLRIPGIAGYLLMLVVTFFATMWGTVEFFHEGWFPPYTQAVFYSIPIVTALLATLLVTTFPRLGGTVIAVGAIAFMLWWVSRLVAQHYEIDTSLWIVGFVIILPGFLFLADGFLRSRYRYQRPKKFSFRAYWKQTLTVVLVLVVILGFATPLFIRNINRMPLEHFSETTVEGNEITLTLAGDGPGWLYSNQHKIRFGGRERSGLSWNEIALFGMEPIGFADKRYGLFYDGTKESIYYATQEDFVKYNMFRYLNREGTELTETTQDFWRLPTAEEYARIFTRQGKNAGGTFDPETGRASYKTTPDKEGPIWAPDMEVIYYWTSSSHDEDEAYDVTFSGDVRRVTKTTAQDYRGFRAVRSKPN